MDIFFISFCTQSFPHDQAKNFSNLVNILENIFTPIFKNVIIYTTQKCKNDFTLNVYEEYKNIPEHSRGCYHSFWRWKPHIIQKQLNLINNGDILIYQDCDIHKYPSLIEYLNYYKKTINYLFESTKNDILIPSECNVILSKHYVKNEIFEKVGKNNDYYRNFPVLSARRIIIKKSEKSIAFINEWLNLCNTDLILPEKYPEPELKWNTHDQAILTVLYRKYMENGIFTNNIFMLKNNKFFIKNLKIIKI